MADILERLVRYPVKSMGGEPLDEAIVGDTGIVGDREWAVYDEAGKLASGKDSRRFRRMDPVFTLRARTDVDRVVVTLPDGREVIAGETTADLALSDHFGEEVEVMAESGVPHQDAAPVSLVGTATLEELGRLHGLDTGVDSRHLRPNLLVTTQEAFVEDSWVGRQVRIGEVRFVVTETIPRCRMVDVAQVDLPPVPGLLRTVSAHRHLMAGVYLDVVQPGTLHVGDPVTA